MRDAVIVLPGVVGGFVAAMYALGALEARSQLHDAGVSTLDALQLIPIEQLLARGIWAVTEPLPFVLGAFIIGEALSLLLQRGVDTLRQRERHWLALLVFLLWGAVALTVVLALAPWNVVLVIVIALVVGFFTLARVRPPDASKQSELRDAAVVMPVALIVWAVASTYLTPDPLPVVTLRTGTGHIRGGFIASDGESWYIANSHRIRAVPREGVQAVEIRRPKKHYPRTLAQLLVSD